MTSNRDYPPALMFDRKPLPPAPVDLTWERFCDEVVDRIEAIRLEEADVRCPTCGTSAPDAKTCGSCRRTLPTSAFHASALRKDGLSHECRDCHSRRVKAWRTRKAIAAIRRAS